MYVPNPFILDPAPFPFIVADSWVLAKNLEHIDIEIWNTDEYTEILNATKGTKKICMYRSQLQSVG